MGQAFKNADIVLTNSFQDVYTCPASGVLSALVIGAHWKGVIAGGGTGTGKVPLWIQRTHFVGSTTISLVEPYIPNPTGTAGDNRCDGPLKAKIVLYPGDKIQAQYDPTFGAAGATLTLSILELS